MYVIHNIMWLAFFLCCFKYRICNFTYIQIKAIPRFYEIHSVAQSLEKSRLLNLVVKLAIHIND